MKKIIPLFLLLFLLTGSFLDGKPPRKYRLVWADEFDGTRLDTTVWIFETGGNGWGNHEKQFYTTSGNVVVKNGCLFIVAKKEGDTYTSARIITRGKRSFVHGYVEIRAKLPRGIGTWPALWLLGESMSAVGWPECGELDVMEHVGKHPGYIHSSVHNQSGYGNTPYTGHRLVKDPFETFHLYAVDWTKNQLTFSVDGKRVHRYAPIRKTPNNWPFDQPMYVIFNLAIGGDWGGPDIDDAIFPQSMCVDYIRVYQK
ncbi:MAG: glycoside hydrolase family 16 protein [Bacteroidota bacterium]|nr:glycoside hydrolase family 16 protein [Bacteroidota bacterium]